MAVKEMPESNSGVNPEVEVEWTAENELQLFQVLCGNKPIGISRFFQMACVVEKLASNLNKEITSRLVWDHLSTMYDLKKLDELEGVPFPLDETDFSLPASEFGDLIASKDESEGKKSTRKEENRKEKSQDQPQSTEKKVTKRTRASMGTANSLPTTPTSTVTPKRRRI